MLGIPEHPFSLLFPLESIEEEAEPKALVSLNTGWASQSVWLKVSVESVPKADRGCGWFTWAEMEG